MPSFSDERRESIVRKMLNSEVVNMKELADREGLSRTTLYNWRNQAIDQGIIVPKRSKGSESWSSEEKFAVVLETGSLNEAELAEYCRKKGLYVEQIARWKRTCAEANQTVTSRDKAQQAKNREDKQRIRELEKELRRKDKALAETAALLVLRKKADAIWGEHEDE